MSGGTRQFRIDYAPSKGGALRLSNMVTLTEAAIAEASLSVLLWLARRDGENEIRYMDGLAIIPVRVVELIERFTPGEAEPEIVEKSLLLPVPPEARFRRPTDNDPTQFCREVWP